MQPDDNHTFATAWVKDMIRYQKESCRVSKITSNGCSSTSGCMPLFSLCHFGFRKFESILNTQLEQS